MTFTFMIPLMEYSMMEIMETDPWDSFFKRSVMKAKRMKHVFGSVIRHSPASYSNAAGSTLYL